jgi:4-amino-4-deoxy-L-arabinose transferase-like glycosyltransferase
VGFIAFAWVYLRGQDSNWDLLNYHYFSGYALLNGNLKGDIAPSGLPSFLNPVPNILSYLALSQLPFPASAWLIAGVHLLAMPLLVLISRQLGLALGFAKITLAEFFALALCLLAPLWWSELGTSFSDATMTPLVLLGLHLGLRGLAPGPEKTFLVLIGAGVCFGLAVGLKLTNAPFALAFLVALVGVYVPVGWRTAFRLALPLLIGLAVGFLPTLWWNIYLLQEWGSPIFPLYNALFKSPYFDLVNFRDMRWRFESIGEFLRYLWESTSGTVKTSEFLFADIRLFIFSVLAALSAVLLILKKGFWSLNNVALSFVYFLGISFLLWATLFAYQRYMIPIEVLFGFGIWVLLSNLLPNHRTVAWLLAGSVFLGGMVIKIPNWGHMEARVAQINPFNVQLSAEQIVTPARYLVVGHAITYLLPFLHKDSQFFGLGTLSRQADALIAAALAKPDVRPLRILLRQAVAGESLWQLLEPFGFDPGNTHLKCFHFRTDIDVYVICEIATKLKGQQTFMQPIALDFRDGKQLLPPSLLSLSGLAAQEPWGRWSDSDQVTLHFANCLPTGKLLINIRGHAFGPNIGKPVRLLIGSNQTTITLGEFDEDVRANLNNQGECEKKLVLWVPEKATPLALGISEDTRALGLGLVHIGIRAGR